MKERTSEHPLLSVHSLFLLGAFPVLPVPLQRRPIWGVNTFCIAEGPPALAITEQCQTAWGHGPRQASIVSPGIHLTTTLPLHQLSLHHLTVVIFWGHRLKLLKMVKLVEKCWRKKNFMADSKPPHPLRCRKKRGGNVLFWSALYPDQLYQLPTEGATQSRQPRSILFTQPRLAPPENLLHTSPPLPSVTHALKTHHYSTILHTTEIDTLAK